MMNRFRSSIVSKYVCNQIGKIDRFVGMEMKWQDDGSLWIHQSKYIKNILKRFYYLDCRLASTPMEEGFIDRVCADKEEVNYGILPALVYRGMIA